MKANLVVPALWRLNIQDNDWIIRIASVILPMALNIEVTLQDVPNYTSFILIFCGPNVSKISDVLTPSLCSLSSVFELSNSKGALVRVYVTTIGDKIYSSGACDQGMLRIHDQGGVWSL